MPSLATDPPIRTLPHRRAHPAAPGLKSTLIMAVVGVLAVSLTAFLVFRDHSPHLSGLYTEQGGPGTLEFKKDRVYVTTLLGMTFAAPYEVDGDRVVIKGAGGSQVYTLSGDTLDAGAGRKFTKSATTTAAHDAATPEAATRNSTPRE